MPSTNPLIDQSANGRFQRTPRLSPYETPNVPKQNIRADYSTPKSQLISTLDSREQTLISLWALQYSVVWNSLVAPISAIPPVLARYRGPTHSLQPPTIKMRRRPPFSLRPTFNPKYRWEIPNYPSPPWQITTTRPLCGIDIGTSIMTLGLSTSKNSMPTMRNWRQSLAISRS